MRITFFLLFITSFAFGQDVEKAIKHIEAGKVQMDSAILALTPKPVVMTYTPYPETPKPVDPITITTTASGFNLDNKKLGGKTDVILTAGTTQNISHTWSVGTADKPVRFFGNNTFIKNVTTSGRSCFYGSTYPRHVQVFNIQWTGNHGGLTWPGGGSTIFVQGVVSTGHNFAGYWVNASSSYEKINSNFLRVSATGGEGLYIGSTTKSALSTINQSHHTHLYVDSTAWDGIQITNAKDVLIQNATVRRTGLADKDGHQRLTQIHACEGLMEKGIFDNWGSPGSCMEFYSEGFTVKDSFISWQGNDQIYCGEWPYATLSNKDLTFDGVIFYVDGTGPLFNNAGKSYKVVVKNSTIPSNRTLAGVIDGGGNKFVPLEQIPRPEYKIETDAPAGMKPAWLIADKIYYDKGWGFRNERQ